MGVPARERERTMGTRVAVVRTSPRRHGNSDILADAFEQGAREAGWDVDDIRTMDYRINYCHGCYGTKSKLACGVTGRCWQKDDMQGLVERLAACDAVCFATPVYYYSMSGQMKVFLDRTLPIYSQQVRLRDVYLLATSESGLDSAMDGTVQGLEGWIRCIRGTRLAGVVRGTGALAPGDVREAGSAVAQAHDLGAALAQA